MCWAIYTLCKKIPETSVAMVGVVGCSGNSVCLKNVFKLLPGLREGQKSFTFCQEKRRKRQKKRERERNTCQNFSGNFLKNKKKIEERKVNKENFSNVIEVRKGRNEESKEKGWETEQNKMAEIIPNTVVIGNDNSLNSSIKN